MYYKEDFSDCKYSKSGLTEAPGDTIHISSLLSIRKRLELAPNSAYLLSFTNSLFNIPTVEHLARVTYGYDIHYCSYDAIDFHKQKKSKIWSLKINDVEVSYKKVARFNNDDDVKIPLLP